jgi:hypothetical protein
MNTITIWGSDLQYTCKCFFNHSAAHRQIPGSLIPATPVINSYYSVVNLNSGLRLETSLNGSNCPNTIDPGQLAAFDIASPTDYFCACPDPNAASNADSTNLLEIPLIGIIVSFLGAVLSSLGQVLMKWAHTHNELRALKDRKAYYTNPLWYVGLVTYAASQILCVVAFASVTQGENAVIGTFSLAANAIFAQKFLGEAMQNLHYVGMFFILVGSTMVLFSTLGVRCINTPEAVPEIDRALSPQHNLPFFLFMMILFTVVLFALILRRLGECAKRAKKHTKSSRLNESLLSSACSSPSSNQQDEQDEQHPNQQQLNELNSTHSSSSSLFGNRKGLGATAEQYSDRAMLFVTISACMGCISSFCASVTVKLLTVEIQSFGTSVSPWIVLAIFVVAICMSMHYLNRGLQSGQALLVVPGYFVGNTMLAMVCSLLYQKTYMYLTVFELVVFFVGFFTSIGGVIAMVWKEMSDDPDRTEAWIKRLATSPRVDSSGRWKGAGGGMPPLHNNKHVLNPYEEDLTLRLENNEIPRSRSVPFPGQQEQQQDKTVKNSNGIFDPNYRGPSPISSGSGSINSSSMNSQEKYIDHGGWTPVAVSEELVDSLSNQGNISNVPYSHTLMNDQ